MRECRGWTDGGGWGGGNPPTTRATKESGSSRSNGASGANGTSGASGDSGGDKDMTRRPGTAALPSTHRGAAADNDSAGSQKRHSDGANGAMPKNGMQLRREYSILAP